MIPTFAQALAAWLLTYALHSTILLGLTWLIVNSRRVGPGTADVLWKAALVGGLLTATTQSALDLRPAGSIIIAPSVGEVAAEPTAAELALDRTTERATLPTNEGVIAGTNAEADSSPLDDAPAPLSLASLLALGWLAVAVILVVAYSARRLVLIGRLGDRRVVDDGDALALLAALCRETGVIAPVRLTSSNAISSPVALGRSEICLPAAALDELEPAQQRAMLAHELAHLVRRDPQWLAFACVIERALFFQPLNRLARRGIQASAEYLADDWAARRTGGVPLARALVKVAEWIQASPLGVPVAGFAEERSQLTARVTRLLDRSIGQAPRSRWGVAALAAGVLALTTAFAPGVAGAVRMSQAEPRTPNLETPQGDEQAAIPAGTKQDTSVVRAVIARLRDEDVDVRRAAADALGRMRDPMAISPLVAALEDEDEEVRKAALHSLGQFPRGVPAAPIRALLASTDADVRSHAVQMLGEMKDRGSIAAITALVSDPSPDVRQSALHALENMEAPVSEATIGRLLLDRSADLRQSAASFAGDRRMTALVPSLIAMLEDPSGDVRESAAHALTEMKTEASHKALRMAITHRDARVRRVAVEYLGEETDR